MKQEQIKRAGVVIGSIIGIAAIIIASAAIARLIFGHEIPYLLSYLIGLSFILIIVLVSLILAALIKCAYNYIVHDDWDF